MAPHSLEISNKTCRF